MVTMTYCSWSIFYAVLACFLAIVTVIVAECPPEPLEKVRDCTASVLPELNSQALSDGPETYRQRVQVLQDSCTKSRLRDTANCIEELLSQCKGTTDEEQLLHRLINKGKTMRTVDYFCEHIEVYERHAACIGNHHNHTWACSQDAHKSFQTKMKAEASMDVLIMGSCRFYAVARTCLTNTTHTFCGMEASNFVFTIMTGLMPPYCDTTAFDDRPEDSTYRWRTAGTKTDDNRNTGNTVFSLSFLVLFVLSFVSIRTIL